MYALYLKNINIEGKGGVAAAPGPGAPAGSYYYHWMRDAGLTMRAYM
jgi:glucoamylase